MTNDLSKTCECCGKVFYKSNTRQTTKSFLTRKYCCRECASKAQGMARRSKKLGKYKKLGIPYPLEDVKDMHESKIKELMEAIN